MTNQRYANIPKARRLEIGKWCRSVGRRIPSNSEQWMSASCAMSQDVRDAAPRKWLEHTLVQCPQEFQPDPTQEPCPPIELEQPEEGYPARFDKVRVDYRCAGCGANGSIVVPTVER